MAVGHLQDIVGLLAWLVVGRLAFCIVLPGTRHLAVDGTVLTCVDWNWEDIQASSVMMSGMFVHPPSPSVQDTPVECFGMSLDDLQPSCVGLDHQDILACSSAARSEGPSGHSWGSVPASGHRVVGIPEGTSCVHPFVGSSAWIAAWGSPFPVWMGSRDTPVGLRIPTRPPCLAVHQGTPASSCPVLHPSLADIQEVLPSPRPVPHSRMGSRQVPWVCTCCRSRHILASSVGPPEGSWTVSTADLSVPLVHLPSFRSPW